MSIVALANVLLGGPAQRWGMATARIIGSQIVEDASTTNPM